jgi:hypothetical protein
VAGRITQPTKCPRESDLRRYQGDLLQSVDADRYPPMVPPGMTYKLRLTESATSTCQPFGIAREKDPRRGRLRGSLRRSRKEKEKNK